VIGSIPPQNESETLEARTGNARDWFLVYVRHRWWLPRTRKRPGITVMEEVIVVVVNDAAWIEHVTELTVIQEACH
jgi:hypothetical protein